MRRRRSVASVAGGLLGALLLTVLVVGLRPLRAQRGAPDPRPEPPVANAPEPADPFIEPPPSAAPAPEPLRPSFRPGLPPLNAAVPPPAGPVGTDDPEKAANDFVDRARKDAEAAVKSLHEEAAALRARLQKVESALQRWQTLITALHPNVNANLPRAGEPAVLEPAPPVTVVSDPDPPTPGRRIPGTVRLPGPRTTQPEGTPALPPADAPTVLPR